MLADEIGPRPACSSGERRAAAWCAARLSEEGYDVVVEEFPSRTSSARLFFTYLTLSAVGALVIVPAPLLAAVIGMIAVVLYGREVDGRPLIRMFNDTSRNVIARPRGGSPPAVVVTAHIDTGRASPLFDPRRAALLRPSTRAVQFALFAVPLAGAGAWIAEAGDELPPRLWVFAVVLSGFLLVAAVFVTYSSRASSTTGANDDASGVEVAMRLAASKNRDDVWFVLTGSDEVGTLGMQAFVERHAADVAHARFLSIDSVGRGTVVATTEEGVLRERRADRVLWGAAESAGAQTRPFRGFVTATSTLVARRFKAASLMALDDRDLVPDRRSATDVSANIEVSTVDEATRIARAVIREALTTEPLS